MSLKHIDGFDQFRGQVGAVLLSSLAAAGYSVTSGLAIEDGRKAGGSALELQVAAGAAGASWSSRTNNVKVDLHAVAANATGRFVAVGDTGNAVYSDDSISWLPLVLGVNTNMKSIKNNASTWMTVGDNGTILRSTDGRNYVPRICPIPAANLRDVAYGGGVWVIAGLNGAVGVLFYSTDDGITWLQGTAPPNYPTINCVAYGGTWCAAGGGGLALTSVDGITWSQTTTANALTISDMEFGNGHLLAVAGQIIWRSVDGGVTWAAITGSLLPTTLTGIVNAGNRWIVIATGGRVLISDDEVTWTPAGFSGAATTALYGICVASGTRVGYAIVGALNNAVSPASAQRALIYLSLAPPTKVTRTFTTTETRLVIGFSHRATARGRILEITDLLEMDWAAGITIAGQVGVAIPARNIWYYYELAIDKVAKTVELYINNTLDMTAPLPDTVTTQDAFEITWLSENGAVTRIDDVYLLDTAAPNGELLISRLGPIQVPLRLPDADAGPNDWTPANGPAHWPDIGILPPSTESFIRSSTSGAQDLFTSSTALPTGDILAVGVVALAQKGDIDNRQLGLVVGAVGAQTEIVDTVLSVTPEYSVAIFEKAPGDVDWDAANVLTTPFGVVVRP